MNESEKGNGKEWFNFTDQQEAGRTGGDFFPSFSGKGFDEIELNREELWGDKSQGSMGGVDRIQVREISKFLFDKFSFAASVGHLPRTFMHYVGELKKTAALDSKTVSALERHISEVEKGTTIEEQQKLFQGIAEYLGKLEMKKI
jgi:hypothetical protein